MAAKSKRRGARRSARPKGRVRQHLAPWARDALGIGLVVFALISVLALWFDAAGVVGRGVRWGLHGGIGAATVVFPLLALYWGILLLRGTAEDDRTRMFIGFGVALVGVLGLLSLWRENPTPLDGWTAVEDAAGVVGAIAAWPLGRLLSEVGAAIVLAGLTVLGLLIFTGTPLATVGHEVAGLFRRADAEAEDEVLELEPEPTRRSRRRRKDILRGVPEVELPDEEPAEPELEPIDVPEIVRPTPSAGRYGFPPIDLLRTSPASAGNERDEEHTTDALERTFHTFGVPAHVRAAHRGPTVTLYEVEVEAGTKVNKVLSLADDIAYALATPDVRIIAPIPGKSAIGVEVPNRVRDFVMLGDILRSRAAKDDRHPLSVALGKDVHGRAQLVNLTKMPHLLIAGATGAGKSSLINSFITSILMRTTPDEVKLVLVDPKRVELTHFADLPHLLVPVIVHPKRAAEALAWVVREMEQRYELLAMVGVRDIDGYRQGLAEG
ncbi:MAG TPA: DNA translocase FtsK 4TM domain-containing protein, partial [Actinomycetota bacterium]|nr:DNA translocase FtsK 4TM domain-containing protein [Actinomycetota bacterium]